MTGPQGGHFLLFLNGILMTGSQLRQRIQERAREARQAIVTANKKASVRLYQFVLRNFQDEGALVGGWVPLAPSTIAYKQEHGYSRMLQNTGNLRASFLPYADDKIARVGSPLAYSAAHDQGTARIPQRRLLPNEEDVQPMVLEIYGREMKIVTGKPL